MNDPINMMIANEIININLFIFFLGGVAFALGLLISREDSLAINNNKYNYFIEMEKPLKLETKGERKELIFHTAYFQIIFLTFSIFVITSSGSLLGMGLVLAFMLHLLIDQIIDLMENNSLDSWFTKFPFSLDAKQKRYFVFANGVILLVLGFFF